ncbi:PREDICTED: jouberin-like [Acromyrmex echinatior]|uniref:jouberin-like n=1 Tax=Acromyrmex echinatior TaxID=103372 RepID=UPI000580C063|nr:PREDICTED: jouberin-like [Acromyrmex echinatior]
MATSAESTRGRRLRRSRNVSSFFDESTENAMSPKTMNVVVDVHHAGESSSQRQQQNNENDTTIDKETKRSSERSSQSSKISSRASERPRNRSSDRRSSSKDLPKHDDLMVESLDLIEEFEAPRKRNESLEEKPRRRKQWNTVANETEVDSKRPPRKRWSKDAGVIRLPETSDDASPLIEDSRKTPVPAPRTKLRRSDAILFDNPAFVSDNEDEVLRIETDHNRESTKIEMRRLSDRSNVEDVDVAGITSSGSSRRHRQESVSERLAVESDDRSSKARFSESRRNSVGEFDSSASLERITDVRSSSIASEERVSSSRKSKPETTRDRSRRRERSLLKKKEPSGEDVLLSSSARDANSMTETDTRVRRKRKKKRKQEKETKEKEEVKFISVTIHRADVLEADYMSVRRPMVRVHIVEAHTGSYLKSTESGGTYIQPMITGKFDFKKNKSMIPVWEEELIFEHNFDAIMRREDGEQVVILFEIIELLSFADASISYDKIGSEGCWNKIAWAFLKPVGTNSILHTDKKVRLQLYKPRRSFKKYGRQKCEVYTWWQSNNRDKYPSSLLVTVTSIPPPKLESVLYQKLPINDLLDESQNDLRDLSKCTSESIGLPKWARLAAQSCKIPNEKMFETEVSERGCFYVAFSNDGKYLACVHSEEYYYPIVVYEVETGKIHVRFLGHKAFVYSLNWSSDDHCLLSASTDQTARIWDVRNQIVQHIEMLPHPSYVYCAKYGPGNATIVATGCYDRVVRIWVNDRRSRKRELNQELEGHEGFVNSMVFQKNGNLITADSVGLIILWTIRIDSKVPSKRTGCILRKIKIREIEGVVINTIVLHPLESRLLVHSRDNGLRMLDLATGVVLQKYKRLNNQRIQLKACISPCGGFVICGSEDSVLNIWNLETGKLVAKYTNDERNSAKIIVTCVDYHPYDHVLAYSIFGNPTSVNVLRYNKDASGNDVGLHFMEDASQSRGNEVILNALSCSRQSKPNVAGRKEMPPLPHHLTADHTIIQIENNDYGRLWTMPHYSREMERNWRKKSWDRLHNIIEKIDSILFGNSMFEDVAKQSSSANERCGSWTNNASNIDLQRDILDDAVNSTRSHDGNNTQSSFTTVSKSLDHSSDFRNSAVALKKTDTSLHISSPDSAGTYIVEMSNFNKNVEGAVTAEEKASIQTIGSDNSRISNVTFLIENERA